MPDRRNPVVRCGTILRKGGAHTNSVSGQRHQSKRQLDDEIDDYFEQHREKPRSDSSRSGKQAKHKKGADQNRPFFMVNFIYT